MNLENERGIKMQKFISIEKDKQQKVLDNYRNSLKGVDNVNSLIDICVSHLKSFLDEDDNRVKVANFYIDKLETSGVFAKLSQDDIVLIRDLICDLL